MTATAVRQRLNRLMAQELIERTAARHGRGRPKHCYRLTPKGLRKSGSNFADLAMALWQEVRLIRDPEVRRGLLQRIAKRMAVMYADTTDGQTLEQKLLRSRTCSASAGYRWNWTNRGRCPCSRRSPARIRNSPIRIARSVRWSECCLPRCSVRTCVWLAAVWKVSRLVRLNLTR